MGKQSVLVIAPHPDDEILGLGGTIARASGAGLEVTVLTVAAHMPPLYEKAVHERTMAEAKEAHAKVGVANSIFFDIPAVFVDQQPTHELNGRILQVVKDVNPAIILCPYFDRHVDHRAIFDAAMVVSRPIGVGLDVKLVAAYETLSETHWNAPHIEPNFTPNWVIDISNQIDRKLDALRCYESQIPPFPGARSLEAVKALAMFRGTQAGFAYGEALHVIRMTAAPEALLS